MLPIQTPDNRFHDGNGSTVVGTIVTADFQNGMQDEILNTIKAAGFEPTAENNQLQKSITKMIDSKAVDAYTKQEADEKFLVKGGAIKTYTTVPAVKEADIVYVDGFGLMKWQTKWNIYRSINCAKKLDGWSKNPLAGQIDANGTVLPKSGIYLGLFTAAKDYELIVAADKWQVGSFHFVDVDDNNFKIPDLRGYSDRNASMGSDIDKDREVFSAQSDAIRNITGQTMVSGWQGGHAQGAFFDGATGPGPSGASGANAKIIVFDAKRVVSVGSDVHPYNTAFPARIQL